MVDYLDLSIDELLLDQDNPRLGAVRNQAEALDKLIKLNPAHFRSLMISIKENGLDPGDRLYIIKGQDEDDYIVLEGNRRLAATRVLANPDVLESTEISSAIRDSLLRAASGFNRDSVEPVRCVVFEGRSEAHDWIYRRHTGAADGEGRINWGSLEIQRFSGDRSILDVIDFVGRNADYSDEEWASTRSTIESKKSTNLARLLESTIGQEHLGITVAKSADERTPMLTSDPKWALAVLKRIIEDVRDGVIDSRSLNKASDIEKYFKDLPIEFQPKKSKKCAPRAFNEINLKAGSAAAASTQKAKEKKTSTPRPRLSLSPKRHEFKPPASTKGQRLLHEAASIDADRYPISAAFVLRAFIEAALDEYMKKNKMPKVEIAKSGKRSTLTLTQCAERVTQHIESNGLRTKKDLHGFRSRIIAPSSSSSIESLNGFVHNKYQVPTADALRAGWDASVPLFVASFGVPDAK